MVSTAAVAQNGMYAAPAPFLEAWRSLVAAFQTWQEERRATRTLSRLDGHLLDDTGLDRRNLESEERGGEALGQPGLLIYPGGIWVTNWPRRASS